jgi:hypothetical protein
VVIYEVVGLKTFRARIGYLLDPETKARPGRFGKNIELRLLKGRHMWPAAWAARLR